MSFIVEKSEYVASKYRAAGFLRRRRAIVREANMRNSISPVDNLNPLRPNPLGRPFGIRRGTAVRGSRTLRPGPFRQRLRVHGRV